MPTSRALSTVLLVTGLLAAGLIPKAQAAPEFEAGDEAHQAIRDGRFPELRGLTNSQDDQLAAHRLCRPYRGIDRGLCSQVASVHMEQSRHETDARLAEQAQAEQRRLIETEIQRREAEAQQALTLAEQRATGSDMADNRDDQSAATDQFRKSEPGYDRFAEVRTREQITRQLQSNQLDSTTRQRLVAAQGKQREANRLEAETQAEVLVQRQEREAAEKIAVEAQAKERREDRASFWMAVKVGLLTFVVIYVAFLIAGIKDKFVVFYDKADFGVTAMVFVSLVIGFFLAAFFSTGDRQPEMTGLQQMILYAALTAAIAFGIWSMILSVRYNRSVPLGIAVGLFKIATALLLFVALLAARPKSKRDTVVGAMNHNRETAIFVAVLAALGWLGSKLINGKRVYEARDWAVA